MKTLGLLETDELYDDLRSDYGSYGQMFRSFFSQLGAPFNYRFYDVRAEGSIINIKHNQATENGMQL